MSQVSEAFAAAQGMDRKALKGFPLHVLRRALGLAKGLEKRAISGGYEQVRFALEEAIKASEVTP